MNSKSSIILISLISFLWLTGCGPTYLPATWDSAPPMYVPSEVKGESNFIGGYYNQSKGFYEGESNKFLRANFARAIGGNWYRFSGCGFAYFGQYNVNQEEKSYFGFGGDVDVNAFLPLYFVNVGIGLYGGLATEFGDYSKVWKDEEELLEILIPYIFPYFFTQFNITENDKLTFRYGVGLPGGYSIGISYYNLNYGGLWIGFHRTKTKTETEPKIQLSFSSFGISVNIK